MMIFKLNVPITRRTCLNTAAYIMEIGPLKERPISRHCQFKMIWEKFPVDLFDGKVCGSRAYIVLRPGTHFHFS